MASERPPGGLTEGAAWRAAARTVLFTFGLLCATWLVAQLKAVVIQVLLAVILAAGMTPLVDHLARRQWLGIGRWSWTPPRALVVLLLYLLLLGAIGLAGALLVPPLVAEVEDLVQRLPQFRTDFQAWVAALPQRYPFLPSLDLGPGLAEQLGTVAARFSGLLGQALVVARVVLGVVAGAVSSVFILVLALYLTADGARIQRYAIGFFPAEHRAQAERLTARIGERLGGWVRGQLHLGAIIGAVTLVGLTLIGVRYAVLLALIAAVGEAVPLVGPVFSAIPAVIVAFTQSPLQGVLTLGLYVVVQQLENHVVVPKVMQRAVALHPLAVMVALLAGAELLGVTGAILSLPVAAALAVVVDELWLERQRAGGRQQVEGQRHDGERGRAQEVRIGAMVQGAGTVARQRRRGQ
jgi:predicted PurR-regulated permease PerM